MTDLEQMLSIAETAIKDARYALANEHEANLRGAINDLLMQAVDAQALVRAW